MCVVNGRHVNDFLQADLGPEGEWAALKEECLELTENQYVYKLCLFGKSTQKPKNGGSETPLG